ncbi:DUF418 domain-containing protein [Nocardiopsis tropica]|uniref:DUF418 domain-containing protein n=1 Tax=Nocardiopsis tropica TaxID=109330 RepID=A0ABU7L0P4_9ACTN|nr:DUF418 domain-containing protein [Nocardiopsis umidischolae]MEE2054447.1 DUF418 domain-containing protein [Nocardiopsis umidischolae]
MTHDTSLPGDGTEAPTARPRITVLDVLRGLALCGILVANIQLIAGVGTAVETPLLGDAHVWLGLPVLSLLFGIGFSLLSDSAAGRAPRPRLALLRRLLALLVIGLLHMLLWRGDILTVYAVVGLLVLLPSTWLPRWAVAGLAAVIVPTALTVSLGGPLLVAGLFLVGSALVRYGVVGRIERSTRGPVVLGLAFAAGAALALWARDGVRTGPETVPPHPVSLLADLLLTGVYVCVLLTLLRTPLRPVLAALFAPLGRMALTNYLTATLLVLGAARILGLPIGSSAGTALSVAGAVLAAQWLFSTLWLRRYRQGPVEWLWRWATWARRPLLRVGAVPSSG